MDTIMRIEDNAHADGNFADAVKIRLTLINKRTIQYHEMMHDLSMKKKPQLLLEMK